MTAPVVIIGAGLGGLSAACHLAGRGVAVTVLEAGDRPGGRAGLIEEGGFRFDTGPTVLTMPNLVEECLAAVGVDSAEVLTMSRVDPMYRASFADGSVLNVRHGRDAMAEEIRSVCGPREAASFDGFCDWLTALYELEMPSFIDRNFDSPLDLLRPLMPAIRLLRLGGLGKLGHAIGRRFEDERLRRIFSFQTMYAGLAPYEALAIYAVITYMDTVNGVFVPVGGMHRLPVVLAEAAAGAGAEIRYGARVERILLAGGSTGAVRGVRLADGTEIATDIVVCNADLPVAYRTLLPGLPPPRRAVTGRYSPSAIVWHAGVSGAVPAGTAHHNIHFGAAWERAFRDVIDEGRRMRDPSLLVTVPSLDDASAAPEGRHVLYVLEPAPNLDGVLDWKTERATMRDRLAARVAALGYPTTTDVEHLVDPLDWRAQGLERGTPFGLAHRFLQTGPFRPANRERRAPGLVFTGSNTVPGVGVPMVLISGRLAAERVVAHRGRR